MSDTPDTNGDGDDANEYQWHEDQDPVVSLGVEVVSHQQLEHQQQQMGGQTDQHGLVVDVFLGVQTVLWPTPPDVRTHQGTQD